MAATEPISATAAELYEDACGLLQARRIGPALEKFDRAEGAGFDPDECGGRRWICHMLAGEFERAWQESDAIASRGALDANRLWSGHSLAGKTIVIRCLHGLGDAIQFLRFASPLRTQAEKVYVEVPACLVRLVRTMPAVDEVITWEGPEVEIAWDDHIEVMELPRYFRVTSTSLPNSVPYLYPPASVRIAPNHGTRKVGVVWAASDWNPTRSVPLHLLQSVLSVPDCSFYSLQKDRPPVNGGKLRSALVPQQLLSADNDVLDTASLILQLDLVITVDTMVAHLAGALGKPVWLLLTNPADWRWMLDRSDSPWYPSMRIFRQSENGKWEPVVKRVAEALAKL